MKFLIALLKKKNMTDNIKSFIKVEKVKTMIKRITMKPKTLFSNLTVESNLTLTTDLLRINTIMNLRSKRIAIRISKE